MCFSAGASFTAAGLLAVIGSVTISKAQKHYRMLASIPFLFGIQQAIEGFLWLSFEHTRLMNYQSYFMYGFLFFAFFLWPMWIPLSLYLVESKRFKKSMLFFCLCAGSAIALGMMLHFFSYPAHVRLVDHHIVYQLYFSPMTQLFGTIIYIYATALPFLISSIPLAWLFGTGLAVSYLVTFYFYYQALTSMWCFFAALLSILLLVIIS